MRTVIEMAREAGAIHIHKSPKEFAVVGNEAIEAFAELVRADEREACARVCDALYEQTLNLSVWAEITAETCATAIRARGNI